MISPMRVVYFVTTLTYLLLVGAHSKIQSCRHKILSEWLTKDCAIARKEKATRRHQFLLFNSQDAQISFNIFCPICKHEAIEEFQWKYIPASEKKVIFTQSNQIYYDSHLTIISELLQPVQQESMYNPCFTGHGKHLVAKNVGLSKYMGTYVCTYMNDTKHPSNFIWHHLYGMGTFKKNSISVAIPQITGFYNQIKSRRQIKAIQNHVHVALNNISELNDRQLSFITITFKADHDDDVIQHCGKITINQYRRCYLKIPRAESLTEISQRNSSGTDHAEKLIHISKILRSSLGFITRLQDYGSNSAQLAAATSRRLGFDTYDDNQHIYVPCEYELLQHVSMPIDNFPPPGRHAVIKYEILCDQIHPKNFTTLLHRKRLINQPLKTTTIEEYHHLKIQNLIVENQKDVVLKCNTNKIQRLKCNHTHMDTIWKSSNNITYTLRTEKNELAYITSDCDLKFEAVKKNDAGTYYCHTIHSTSAVGGGYNTSYIGLWSGKPIIVYRLRIQRRAYEKPYKNYMKTDLAILSLWSLVLTILCTIFSCYKLHAQNSSLELALHRKRQHVNLVCLQPSAK
ncbi:unnamed protein product [Heterobilharzia americana]|nr:unnamed protein product [Heterobilharzia americana]